MSGDVFNLRPPRWAQMPDALTSQPIARLRRLTASLPEGIAAGDTDLIENLRERLKAAANGELSWEEAINMKRWKWLLISLYTLDLGTDGVEEWLCDFDENVAQHILGDDPMEWHSSRRRDVTQLFFTQFDRITAVAHVAAMLRQAWEHANSGAFDQSALTWAREAATLFAEDGPERLAEHWQQGESPEALADRYHVHHHSRYRERLLQAVLLGRLRKLRFGSEDPLLFSALFESKSSPAGEGRLLGSRAVELIVRRAIDEQVQAWNTAWSSALVSLGCDPRIPIPAQQRRWWGWATQSERDVAIRALTSLTLREFIKLLEDSLRGTNAENQFHRRRDFLLTLFDNGQIQEARLVIAQDLFHRLDRRTRDHLMLSKVSGNAQGTSMICLRCTDDIFLIEGTHSFGLRGFVGQDRFPIRRFWDAAPRTFHDTQLRVSESHCDIYQRHHVGDWVSGFFDQLERRCHVRWPRF